MAPQTRLSNIMNSQSPQSTQDAQIGEHKGSAGFLDGVNEHPDLMDMTSENDDISNS